MAFLIRLARAEDGAAVCRLNLEALGYDYPLAETCAVFGQVLLKPNARIWIAEAQGRAVGYLHATDYDCVYAPPMKNILSLAVSPLAQRQGIGRALLMAAEAWAREDGACGLRLVSGYNREGAHGFYLACGYTMRKEQKNFMKRWDGKRV